MHDGHCGSEAPSSRKNTLAEVLTNDKMKMRRRLILETYLTQLALSTHSFFECMSIGIELNETVVFTLASAIVFHKWAEALTLGFSYSSSGMAVSTAIKFALFHSILNGSAVILGMYISEMSEGVKGICNAIAGGTFIYICMVEKINK